MNVSTVHILYSKLEGCNLVENSTRPDPTVNNFNPTRQEPDTLKPDQTFTTETRTENQNI